jgi:hypothetical protein
MDDLIEALQIFRKYGNPYNPTHCAHEIFYICGISADDVSDEDKKKLEVLSFFFDEDDDLFKSYRFGSA